MGGDRGKQLALVGLLGVLAVVVYWRFLGGDEAGPRGVQRAVERGVQVAQALPELRDVPVELLRGSGADYDPGGRNLFGFGQPPSRGDSRAQDALAARRAQNAARRAAAERTPPPPQPPREVKPPPPQPPPVGFKYLGYLGERDDLVAVFLDGEEIVLAREGEPVLEQFRLERIGFESVEIGYTDPKFEDAQPKVVTLGS